MKKAGILLILTGVFILIITYPYLTGYQSSYLQSIPHMKLIISENTVPPSTPAAPESVVVGRILSERINQAQSETSIPYKHIIAFSTLLIFLGMALLLLLPKKDVKNS